MKKKKALPPPAVEVAAVAPSFFNWPGSIDRVCARICAGGTLVDFCKEFNQNYRAVLAWIDEDEGRRKRYADALVIRKHHHRELIIRDLMQLRDFDIMQCCYDSGALKPLQDIPESARRWIESIKTMDYYEGAGAHRILIGELKEIKTYDKMKAVKLLVECLKMIDDGAGGDAKETLEDILAGSWGQEVEMETVTATRTRVSIGAKQ